MNTAEFLVREREVIVRDAEQALTLLRERHYESAGAGEVRRRLDTLFDHLVAAVETRDLTSVIAYARDIAEGRFADGYDLSEVQAAFNVLEAATWSRILASLEPAQLAEALGLVSTVGDLQIAAFSEIARESVECGDEPEIVERGRAEVDRELANTCECVSDELSQAVCRRLVDVLERSQAEQDRGQRLSGLVVQLAGDSLAFELLSTQDPRHGFSVDALGEGDRNRGPVCERLDEPIVGLRETRIGAGVVVDRDRSDRLSADEERDEDRGPDLPLAGEGTVGFRVVEHRVDAFAAPAVHHRGALGAAGLEASAHGLDRPLACRGSDLERPVRTLEGDIHEAGVDELLDPLADQPEDLLRLVLVRERVAHLRQGLELTRPADRRLVETGVLDRDRGLRCEQLDQAFILFREAGFSLFFGQVEVSVGDAAEEDRHPQERRHRRMTGREADRPRIGVEVIEPQAASIPDQSTEDTAATRQLPDRSSRLLVDAVSDEPLEVRAAGIDHA